MGKEIVQNTEGANESKLSKSQRLLIGTFLIAGIVTGVFIGRDSVKPITFRVDTNTCGSAYGAPIDAYTINPLSDDQIGIITSLSDPNISVIYNDETGEFLLKCGVIMPDTTITSTTVNLNSA